MKRTPKLLFAALFLACAGAFSPTAAFAQAGAASAIPKAGASATPSAKPAASAKPTGAPSAGAPPAGAPPAGAPSAGAPPAGAPPAGALPPGHPHLDDDEGDADEPAPGANPHAAGAGEAPKIFRPPADGAQDDPELPQGTIVVVIRDAEDKPIARAPVTLGIHFSSVAKGDSSQTRTAEADETGLVRFDGLGIGSGLSYRISTPRGRATYSVMAFPLHEKVGKRVVLHSYDIASEIERLPLGIEGFVYLSLKEDAIQVEQMFSVLNLGAVTWVADLPVDLPKGFRAFTKQDNMDDARVEELSDRGVALRGSFAPGRHEVSFRYQVPLDDEPRQTLTIELPPRVFQAQVLAESSKTMGLEVSDFPTAQRTQNRQGKRMLATERQFPRREGKQTLNLTLSGLPTAGPGRWIAVLLASTALLAGGAVALQKRDEEGPDEDMHRDLIEAREALLAEIVALTRAHKKGDIGPKSFARLRVSLLDALARIEAMVEETRASSKASSKRRSAEAT